MPFNYYGQNSPLLEPSTGSYDYERPKDWIILPVLTPEEERMVGLFPVFDDQSNFLAVYFEGDYTVDWGDGDVENFSSGAQAEHTYDFASIDPTSLTTRGYKQVVVSVTPQLGSHLELMNLSVAHSSFYSDTNSVPWLDITLSMPNAISGQSIIFGDQNQEKYLGSVEQINILTTGGATDLTYAFYYCTSLKNLCIANLPQVTTAYEMCYNCSALQNVVLPDIQGYWEYAFDYCYSLRTLRLGDISLLDPGYYLGLYEVYSLIDIEIGKIGSDGYDLFSYAGYVQKVTIHDASELEDASYMFEYCYALKEVYLGPTPNLKYADYMFYECTALESVEFTSLPLLESFYDTFDSCSSLRKFICPATPLLSNADYTFYNCRALGEVVFTDLTSLSSLYETFYECEALSKVELNGLPSNFIMEDVFNSCFSLTSLNFSSAPGTFYNSNGYYWYGLSPIFYCTALTELSFSDCSQIVLDGYYQPAMFIQYCTVLSKLSVPGIAVELDLSYCTLSRDAIVSVFNDLGTVVSPTTINVTGNWGAAGLTAGDIQIATDKGWTVLP